jgi:Fe-S-cluster containining protein
MTETVDYKPISVDVTVSDNKCDLCEGSKCCNYITQAIDTPRSIEEFDTLLWQLAHANVQAYKDEDGWFLLVNNKCQFLGEYGRCKIYDTRPQMCRDYSNDYCEYDAPAEDGFELFFDGYDSLLKYCQKRFKKWDKRFKQPG